MKNMIYIIIFLLLSSLSIFAQPLQQKFDEANELYTKGQYSSAIDLYEELLKNEYNSSELYFNLANAYYKLNDISYAILYYEKAKKLAPADEDIDYNLRIANLQTVDKIKPVPEFFLNRVWNDLVLLTKPCNWSWAFVIFFWLAFVCFAIFYLSGSSFVKKTFFALGGLSILISILLLFISIESNDLQNSHDNAIVFEPSIYVKASPDDSSTDLFILHEGTKIKILDQVGEWRKIKIADGNTGWLPADSFLLI